MYTYGMEYSVLFSNIRATLKENYHPNQRYLLSLTSRIERRLKKIGSGSLNSALWCAVRVALHLPIQNYLIRYSGEELAHAEVALATSVCEAVKEMAWDTDLRCNKYRLTLFLEDLLLEICAEY